MNKMAKMTAIPITVVLVMLFGTSLHAKKGGGKGRTTTSGTVLLRDCVGGVPNPEWEDPLLNESMCDLGATDDIQSDNGMTYVVVEISSASNGGKFNSGVIDETNPGRTQDFDFGSCFTAGGCDARFFEVVRVRFKFGVSVSVPGGVHGMGVDDEVDGRYGSVFAHKYVFGGNSKDIWTLSFDKDDPNCDGSSGVKVKRLAADPGVWEVRTPDSGGKGCLRGGKRTKGQEEFAGIYEMNFAMLIVEDNTN